MNKNQKQYRLFTWLVDHWPKATLFLALYTFILLYLFIFHNNLPLFLLWVQTPIYWLHQFEEYVFPGKFAEFFNHNLLGSKENGWPLTPKTSFWINIPIIFIAFPLSAILAGFLGLGWGIWAVYFSILNAVSHVGMFIRLGYNPGFGVSLFLNIPVGVFTLITFINNGLVTSSAHITGAVIALLIQGSLMVWGLVFLRKRVKLGEI